MKWTAAALVPILSTGGCGTPSSTAVERFKSLTPGEQIRTIQESPAPPGRKIELIKDIELRDHVTAGAAPVGGRAPELSVPSTLR